MLPPEYRLIEAFNDKLRVLDVNALEAAKNQIGFLAKVHKNVTA
jgi:hypothetical protein